MLIQWHDSALGRPQNVSVHSRGGGMKMFTNMEHLQTPPPHWAIIVDNSLIERNIKDGYYMNFKSDLTYYK